MEMKKPQFVEKIVQTKYYIRFEVLIQNQLSDKDISGRNPLKESYSCFFFPAITTTMNHSEGLGMIGYYHSLYEFSHNIRHTKRFSEEA